MATAAVGLRSRQVSEVSGERGREVMGRSAQVTRSAAVIRSERQVTAHAVPIPPHSEARQVIPRTHALVTTVAGVSLVARGAAGPIDACQKPVPSVPPVLVVTVRALPLVALLAGSLGVAEEALIGRSIVASRPVVRAVPPLPRGSVAGGNGVAERDHKYKY